VADKSYANGLLRASGAVARVCQWPIRRQVAQIIPARFRPDYSCKTKRKFSSIYPCIAQMRLGSPNRNASNKCRLRHNVSDKLKFNELGKPFAVLGLKSAPWRSSPMEEYGSHQSPQRGHQTNRRPKTPRTCETLRFTGSQHRPAAQDRANNPPNIRWIVT
jgi:hypothetical protein